MKSFLFIFYTVIIFAIIVKRDWLIKKILSPLLSLNNVLIFYFGCTILFAIIYAGIDCYIIHYLGTTDLLTVYNPETYSSGHIWDYFYFSVVTQLTLGYGDLSPHNSVSQFIAISQGIFGTLFIGALIYSIINYSSELNIDKIILKISEGEFFDSLEFKAILTRNEKVNYENIKLSLFTEYNNEKFLLATKSIKSLSNLESISLLVSIDDPRMGDLYVKNNKLFYYSNEPYEEKGKYMEETIDFEIDFLKIEYSFTKGDFYSLNTKSIDAIESVKRIISRRDESIELYI